jgi:hypothetical protein
MNETQQERPISFVNCVMLRSLLWGVACGLVLALALPKKGGKEAKLMQEQLARRGSDNPHSFKPTTGFRTCRTCGLPEKNKVHDVRDSAN